MHESFDITINNDYVMQAQNADNWSKTDHKQKNTQ